MSSLIHSDSFPLGEPRPELGAAPSAARPGREVNLLGLAWRNRWLLLLMALVGGGAGWALLQRMTPHYTSVSRIYVEQNMPRLLENETQMARSTSFLYTQAELIRSTPVLAAAVEAPGNQELAAFREADNPVGLLREELDVSVGTQDDIISVGIELPDPDEAAQIVNSIIESYISKYAERRKNSAAEVLNILRTEMESREGELERCRQALDDFRKQNAELAVQVQDGNVVTQRFGTLAQELNKTEVDLLAAKAMYYRAKRMYDTPQQRPFLLEMASAEHQAMRDMELEKQVQILEQALSSERSQWGEGHPKVKLLREQLEMQREKLDKKQLGIIEAYVETVRQEYELLSQKREELQAEYDRSFASATEVSAKLTELQALEDAYDRTEKLCDILDERIKEVNLSEQAADSVGAIVNIVDYAAPAPLNKPSFPSRPQFLAGGILLGGMLGFGLAWLREMLDQRLKSVDEVTEVTQLSVLGVIPHGNVSSDRPRAGQMVALAPRSSIAEAIRTLRTAIHFGLADHSTKVIAVTSPLPGDGKSTVASNLAIAMAQADQRVLLIDADLRKPTQHLIFELTAEAGLSTVLADRRPAEQIVVPSGQPSLDVLPCGPLPANPVELLNNGYFAELLEQLKTRYDKIVIDAPPVMPVADARVVAAIADATLLVLRAERSTRRMAVGARNELWRVRATRLGVIVNAVPPRKQGAYSYGDGYGYGGRGYGYGYGGYGDDGDRETPAPKKARALVASHAADEVD